MTIVLAAAVAVLIAALVAVNIAYIRLLERKDARHDVQVNRLLHWQHQPETASLEQIAETRDGPAFTNEFREQQARLLELVTE